MNLTPENKAKIDSRSYEQLLGLWRFAPLGDPWFQGETGEYWSKRMSDHVGASKHLGWEK